MSKQPFLPFDDEEDPAAAPASAPPPAPKASDARPLEPPSPPAARQLSRLVEELARVCARHPLEEKILLAPSLLAGHQLVERLARSGRVVVQLRVETIRTLAHAIAGPELAREGARLLSRAQALALLEQACAERLTDDSYFGALRERPGFHRALQSALDELRAAGLSPGALPPGAFTDPRKPRELQRVLEGYEAALASGRWVDRAEVLRRAAAAVESASASAARGGPSPLYLHADDLDLSAVERGFVEALAGTRRIVLATDPPEDWTARAAAHGNDNRIFRAVGEENEIRAVFREVLASGIPFDEVEVLHTDASTYPALAYELVSEHGVPATFSAGIAATFTLPGRAALAFLQWVEGGFEAEALREALATGVLTFPSTWSSRVGPLVAAREMRRAMIGWGRDRHLSALDRLAQEIAFRRPRSDDDDDEASRVARRDRRLAAVATARTFVARALSLLPAEDAAPLADLARATRTFVAEFGRVRDELDGTAGAALAKLLMELESLPGRDVPLESAAGRLAEAVRSLHFAPERPRPGRIHFADFRAGGFSGRSHTFVVGLDEKRHPGQGHEDPVLSDQERRGISELSSVTLALAPDRSAESARALRACVSRLRGNVSFGYAGWTLRDLLNPGEVFPSPFLLEAFRARGGGDRGGGSAGADYGDLSLATGEGEGFVPDASRALDETEWWLARIGDRRGQEAEGAVAMLHPWLADGLEAEEARSSPVWTRWDGVFTAPTPELDPRASSRPMSASRIQMLAECPFGYFLRHVLRLAPPDEPEDRGKGITWLDPRGIGSLIHRVFRRFLEALAAKGRRPSHPADLAALEAVAEEELAAMRLRVPPRSELAFSRRRDDVLFACRTFLLSEAARASEAEPIAFEVAFGTSRIDEERAPEFPDPVEIALPRGRSFRLRGSIDRVDRDSAGRYHVWDYKTGSAFFVHEEQGISAGRQIQPALYALAWESLQAGQGKTEARVATSGFFFPGKRGLGERFAIAYSVDETRRTLDTLFDLLATGAFPHTPDKDSDCFACKELVRFCPNNEEAGKTSKTKFDSLGPLAPALAAWKKLRDE